MRRLNIVMKRLLNFRADSNGSAIVGVLAALVFIGVVVGLMVKNTGAQSAASAGYGMAMTMQSTAQSGMVATEGYFLNNTTPALQILDSLRMEKYVFGSNAQGKRPLSASSGQYFSSKAIGTSSLIDNIINGGNLKAGFQIGAGKSAKGKIIQDARAFYQFGNITKEADNTVPAKNAVYSFDGVNNADASLHGKGGGVTFEGDAKFQNAPATFEGDAFFGKKAYFPSVPATFKDKAYFMDSVTFQGTASFDSLVYFKNFAYFSSPATFKGKVYFLNGAEFKSTVSFDSLVYFTNTNNTQNVLFYGNAVFKGNAYFAKSIEFSSSATATFNKTAYFTQTSKFDGLATFNGTSYFSGKPTFKASVFGDAAYFLASTGATFEGNAEFKAAASAYFDNGTATATFGSTSSFGNVAQFMSAVVFTNNVTFSNWAYFGNTASFNNAAGTFWGEAYFKELVTFSNKVSVFHHRLAIEKNIQTNQVIESQLGTSNNKFDVLISGKFNSNEGGIKGTGVTDHSLFYKNGVFTPSDIARCTNFFGLNGVRGNDDLNNGVWASGKLNQIKTGTASNLLSAPTLPALPTIPTPPTAESRRDPQLAITAVYNASTANGGSVVIHNAKDAMTINQSTFNLGKLRTTYANALTNSNTLYMGKFLVIEVTSNISFTSDFADEVFDANIIYIIKDGGTLNTGGGNFYSSSDTSNASTLIYVGSGNAQLAQFGAKNTFRGFIYIDAANTADNSINFSNSSGQIIGAVHNFSSKPLAFNTGGHGPVKVVFSAEVLNGFGSLYPANPNGPPSSTGGITLKPGATGIDVKALGYYFY